MMASLSERIEQKLQRALQATRVEVQDDSAAHAGHGASGAHVDLVVESAAFVGKSRVARHRLVYEALKDEMQGDIHALAIRALAPGEK